MYIVAAYLPVIHQSSFDGLKEDHRLREYTSDDLVYAPVNGNVMPMVSMPMYHRML